MKIITGVLVTLLLVSCGKTDTSQNDGNIAPVSLVKAFSQLSFNTPVFATSPNDSTQRLFVVELGGTIKVFENNSQVSAATTFLDISADVASNQEEGLLGMAFDPNYVKNGYFYIYYSVKDAVPAKNRLVRYSVSSGDANLADVSSATIMLEIEREALSTSTQHNAGMLAFDQNGKLFVAVGDGGTGTNAQDKSVLWGKILRLDPHLPAPYIPSDNPYYGSLGSQRQEIWAIGLRNPWRFSIDPVSNTMWVGDVGGSKMEEINIVHKDDNFGWNIYEGTESKENPLDLPYTDFTPAFLTLPHDDANGADVVIGGYVYRGLSAAGLYGKYIYGDRNSGKIWAVNYEGETFSSKSVIAEVSELASFGVDNFGEVYVITLSGNLFKMIP